MSPLTHPKNILNTLERYRFLMILNAANLCEEYQFAKQAAMLWLVNYPGDLFVKYHQAMAYANLDQHKQSITLLEELVNRDPLFLEPTRVLSQLSESADRRAYYSELTRYLERKNPPDENSIKWLLTLWQARIAYTKGDLEQAISLIHTTLVENPPTPIPAILHLQTAYKIEDQEMLNNLSEMYLEHWPNCLQINVIRALVEMDLGHEAKAVERLHWVAANDSAEQVIQHLMGVEHSFKNLWPDRMEINFDLPIPASVSAYLGWNQLQTGQTEEPIFKPVKRTKSHQQSISGDVTQKIHVVTSPQPPSKFFDEIPQEYPGVEQKEELVENVGNKEPISEQNSEKWASDEDFEEIQQVFSNIARRLKKPDLDRADNRFPVYVVMTSKKQLEKTYGPNTTNIIDEQLTKLVSLIQVLPDWNATLFYPDDPQVTTSMGINPVIGSDPWQNKLALADLDQALAKRGEMIGALLIVGGPEIVPFHHLPNPTFDNDLDVPSDNPYACIDENYFIPQWPVGRLPGETGSDAGVLLQQIRDLIRQYEKRAKMGKSIVVNVASMINWIMQFFSNLGSKFSNHNNWGYSAEIWQRASAQVFKNIGNAKDLDLSPPIQAHNLYLQRNNGNQAGYFNLHGVKDGPHWYGQKDFRNASNGPDYPIALSPSMFNEDHPSPKLIVTEACYGANVQEKQYEDAMAIKCFDTGTATFVGSTCIAYGSITPPLIAADFLADKFWKKVLEGLPVGYALMQAKLSLAEEMTKIQGFLDGEDQKTLLSFVLYGDPLAIHEGLQTMPKPLIRFKSYPTVKTISDHDMQITSDNNEMPKHVNKQVKKVVEKYLPGLENAQMQFKKSGESPMHKSGFDDGLNIDETLDRFVVTLRKTYDENQQTPHHHFARMTFDKKGKLVKFSTSR